MNGSPRKKLTKIQGFAIIEAFYKSGLKSVRFCTQKNIPYNVFRYWFILFKKQSEINTQPANFLPVKIKPPQPILLSQNPLKVYLKPGIAIEVPVGFDITTFKQVLEVFQACG
jgi:hypothetical protein